MCIGFELRQSMRDRIIVVANDEKIDALNLHLITTDEYIINVNTHKCYLHEAAHPRGQLKRLNILDKNLIFDFIRNHTDREKKEIRSIYHADVNGFVVNVEPAFCEALLVNNLKVSNTLTNAPTNVPKKSKHDKKTSPNSALLRGSLFGPSSIKQKTKNNQLTEHNVSEQKTALMSSEFPRSNKNSWLEAPEPNSIESSTSNNRSKPNEKASKSKGAYPFKKFSDSNNHAPLPMYQPDNSSAYFFSPQKPRFYLPTTDMNSVCFMKIT